jgi:hypothetical protein
MRREEGGWWWWWCVVRDGDHLPPNLPLEFRPEVFLKNSHEVWCECEFDIDVYFEN